MTQSLIIVWRDGESKGEVDRIPMNWLASDGYKQNLIHDVRFRRSVSTAKCDITCKGNVVIFDYKDKKYNNDHDMLLGIMRIRFSDSERQWPLSGLQWKDADNREFSNHKAELSIVDDFLYDIAQLRGRDSTTREQLIDARRGQGRFRQGLLRRWNEGCAVTGIKLGAILRASHIKPWNLSDDRERLNPSNGLLLSANLDALFDQHLITFSDDGEMWISSRISSAVRAKLGLPANLLRPLDAEERIFMDDHRARATGDDHKPAI